MKCQTINNNKYADGYNNNKCSKCGKTHDAAKCSAAGMTCHICQKVGHYAKCCHNKKGGDSLITSLLVFQYGSGPQPNNLPQSWGLLT